MGWSSLQARRRHLLEGERGLTIPVCLFLHECTATMIVFGQSTSLMYIRFNDVIFLLTHCYPRPHHFTVIAIITIFVVAVFVFTIEVWSSCWACGACRRWSKSGYSQALLRYSCTPNPTTFSSGTRPCTPSPLETVYDNSFAMKTKPTQHLLLLLLLTPRHLPLSPSLRRRHHL